MMTARRPSRHTWQDAATLVLASGTRPILRPFPDFLLPGLEQTVVARDVVSHFVGRPKRQLIPLVVDCFEYMWIVGSRGICPIPDPNVDGGLLGAFDLLAREGRVARVFEESRELN